MEVHEAPALALEGAGTLIGLVGTFVASVWVAGWKAGAIVKDLEGKISAAKSKMTQEISDSRDATMRAEGDGINAIRTKVGLLELEVERSFVRRVDFQIAIDTFMRSVDALRADIKDERVETRGDFGRLSEKLDDFMRARDR